MILAIIFAFLTLIIPITFSNYVAAILLMPVALGFVKIFKEKFVWKIWIFGALLGPISEIISIRSGLWQYTHADFSGIPIWLPLVWGNAFTLGAYVYKIKSKK